MAREQEAKSVARKSDSSENKGNVDAEEEVSTKEPDASISENSPESSDTEPVILDAEVVESAEIENEGSTDATLSDNKTSDESDVTEHLPEETSEPAASAESKSGTSFLVLALGGLVAGAIGFFAAEFRSPAAFDPSELQAGVAANSESLSTISADLQALQNEAGPEVPDLSSEVGELMQALDGLKSEIENVQSDLLAAQAGAEAQASELDVRILALETAVPEASELRTDDELAALRERIAEMTASAQQQLSTAQSEAANVARAAEEARLAAEAEAAELRAAAEEREAELQAMAERQEALIKLKSAVEAGAPFSDILTGLDDVPEVIAANAADGVPSVQALQNSFPDLARSALAQSVNLADDASAGDRISAFFKKRVNARSLTPQDGDTPNAVLSRVEAVLSNGDVSAALLELELLPETGQAVLSSWREQAETRQAVIIAVDQLSAEN